MKGAVDRDLGLPITVALQAADVKHGRISELAAHGNDLVVRDLTNNSTESGSWCMRCVHGDGSKGDLNESGLAREILRLTNDADGDFDVMPGTRSIELAIPFLLRHCLHTRRCLHKEVGITRDDDHGWHMADETHSKQGGQKKHVQGRSCLVEFFFGWS